MYPTIVVILVHYESSKEEMYGISVLIVSGEIVVRDVEARPATVGHLVFATPQSTTGSAGIRGFDGPTEGHDAQGEKGRIVIGEDSSVGSKAEHGHV